jgi:5-methylcytosine-specific restriction endonuclease McrA
MPHNPKYSGSVWMRVRAAHLRASPFCKECERYGELVPATIVHHLDHNPRNDAPSNLQSLCWSCHSSHHSKNPKPRIGLDGWPEKPLDENPSGGGGSKE